MNAFWGITLVTFMRVVAIPLEAMLAFATEAMKEMELTVQVSIKLPTIT